MENPVRSSPGRPRFFGRDIGIKTDKIVRSKITGRERGEELRMEVVGGTCNLGGNFFEIHI